MFSASLAHQAMLNIPVQSSNPFVTLLVIGDSHMVRLCSIKVTTESPQLTYVQFSVGHAKALHASGAYVAEELRAEVQKALKTEDPKLYQDVKIAIRVYVDTQELGKYYKDCGFFRDPLKFHSFVEGFNSVDGLTEMIPKSLGRDITHFRGILLPVAIVRID